MNRGNSIFDESRLYRQAEDGAVAIMSIITKPGETERILSSESELKSVIITSIGDADLVYEYLSSLLDTVSHQISSSWAIPILLQLLDKVYYSPDRISVLNYGRSTKILISRIAGNVYGSQNDSDKKAMALLIRGLLLAELVNQLDGLRGILRVAPVIPEVPFSSRGIEWPSELLPLLDQMNTFFSRVGKIQRTLDDSVKAIWSDSANPANILTSINQVLEGAEPSSIPAFQGTIFAQIDNRSFWLGIASRLMLFWFSMQVRMQVSGKTSGIAVFQSAAYRFPKFSCSKEIEKTSRESLFWENNWYDIRRKDWESNMVVERPVLRIHRNMDTFVVNPLIIGESLNFFVETSLFDFQGAGGAKLHPKYFRSLVSEPFECRAIREMRKLGFLAGRVTEKGTWENQEGKSYLSHPQGASFPGELDLLAYNKEANLLIVADCKLLGHPHTHNRMKSIVDKLSISDSEKFYGKLHAKSLWIDEAFIKKYGGDPPLHFDVIITDENFPALNSDQDHKAVSLDDLLDALKSEEDI